MHSISWVYRPTVSKSLAVSDLLGPWADSGTGGW